MFGPCFVVQNFHYYIGKIKKNKFDLVNGSENFSYGRHTYFFSYFFSGKIRFYAF